MGKKKKSSLFFLTYNYKNLSLSTAQIKIAISNAYFVYNLFNNLQNGNKSTHHICDIVTCRNRYNSIPVKIFWGIINADKIWNVINSYIFQKEQINSSNLFY